MAENNSNSDQAVTTVRRRLRRIPFFFTISFSFLFFLVLGCCYFGRFVIGLQEFSDANSVNQVAAEITDWKLPKGFEPDRATEIRNSAAKMFLAKYRQSQGRGWIVVAQISVPGAKTEDFRVWLDTMLRTAAPELKKIDSRTTRTFETTIREQKVTFEVVAGEDLSSTTKYRKVQSEFPGKLENALLILQCEQEYITDEEIDQFLSSIH